MSIPPKREGRGKITLTLQGRFTEADAVTDGEERISVDETVEILSSSGDFFVVRKKAESEN